MDSLEGLRLCVSAGEGRCLLGIPAGSTLMSALHRISQVLLILLLVGTVLLLELRHLLLDIDACRREVEGDSRKGNVIATRWPSNHRRE